MKQCIGSLLAAVFACLFGAGALAQDSPWQIPGDLDELTRACSGRPGLEMFGQNGYLGIECGYQALLLGSRIPIAPAPHVPWAKPYARGPIKVLIITTFGNAPTDVEQLAQAARALDADLHWLLVADAAVTAPSTQDAAYRTRFLAEQARQALREEYDAIVVTFGTNTPGYGLPPAQPYFADDIYRLILDKVQRGTGLVLVGQTSANYWLEQTPLAAVSPARMRLPRVHRLHGPATRLTPAGDSPLFAGLGYVSPTFTEDSPLVVYDWQLHADSQVLARMSGLPLVMARNHGKGRVVLLGWDGTFGPVWRSRARAELEHGTALALRALSFAAHKEPIVALAIEPPRLRAAQAGTAWITLSRAAQVSVKVRDAKFRVLAQHTLGVGSGRTAVSLPTLAKGHYFLEVIARDERGRVLTWGDESVEVEAALELRVTTERSVYKQGETVHVTGELLGVAASPELQVQVEVRDATGRVLGREHGPYTGALRFAYPIRDALVAPHRVTFTVSRGQAPLIEAASTFYVPSSNWDDYENILWPQPPSWQINAKLRDEAGITAVFDQGGSDRAAELAAHFGLRVARMNAAPVSPELAQLAPARAMTQSDATLTQAIAAAQRYGALAWVLQDERGQLADAGMPESATLPRYREYLKARYGSLSALNASWGSGHRGWQQVSPVLTKQIEGGVANLAAWVDFRLFVSEQTTAADKHHIDMVRGALGAEVPIGLDGFVQGRHVVPYGALDVGRLAGEGVASFYAPYDDDLLISSLVQGPKAKYLRTSSSRNELFGAVWREAFRGFRGTLCFFGPTFYSDFGWVQPAGHRLEEGTRQLRAGVGKLLIGSERELAPIVVLYSYPSQLTSVASRYWSGWQGTEGLWDAAVESRLVLEKMLLGSGVSFGYQTDTQIAGGTLRGAKLLIIPWHMGLALSNATVRAIERFVRDGGTLLAELPPAQADEHGKRLARGALDELFGVRSSQSAPRHSARDYGALVRGTDGLAPQGEWFVDEWYDARLQVTTGKAAGVHLADNAPAFVVKRTGRGQALLVNMLFASLKVGQSTASGEQYALMRSVLSAAQVAPLAEFTSRADPNPSCCEVNRFRDHDNQYYGVFAHTQPSAQPLVVRFADTRDTYDVRAGRYLGRVQETELSLRAGDAVLLARLDYKLAGLQLIARPAVRGEPVVVAVQLAASRTPGRHIVHVQVTDPKGMARPLYTQNVVIRGGQGELSFLPALNEPAGDWRIEAREVVSGLSAQCSVRLP